MKMILLNLKLKTEGRDAVPAVREQLSKQIKQ